MRARCGLILMSLGFITIPSGCVLSSSSSSGSGDEASDAATEGATSTSQDSTDTSTDTSTDMGLDEASDATSMTDGPGPVCGDGNVDPGEACDDGNADEQDGCSSMCEILASCPGLGSFCEATPESCPPSAQVNAAVEGETPLGPFTGTFVAFSGAFALGDLGTMVILPEYVDGDLCESPPRLLLALGPAVPGPSYAIEVPARFHDGQGAYVDAVAAVTVHACCEMLWFCSCASPDPYWIDLVIEGEGWSLAGTATPNCCRSYSIDEAA